MTVQDLIDELLQLDPDYIVIIDGIHEEFSISTDDDNEEINLQPQD